MLHIILYGMLMFLLHFFSYRLFNFRIMNDWNVIRMVKAAFFFVYFLHGYFNN